MQSGWRAADVTLHLVPAHRQLACKSPASVIEPEHITAHCPLERPFATDPARLEPRGVELSGNLAALLLQREPDVDAPLPHSQPAHSAIPGAADVLGDEGAIDPVLLRAARRRCERQGEKSTRCRNLHRVTVTAGPTAWPKATRLDAGRCESDRAGRAFRRRSP